MKTANLGDLPWVRDLLGQYQQEILSVPVADIKKAILDGRCLVDDGVCLIYKRLFERSYYGVGLAFGAYQIAYFANANKGNGKAGVAFDEFVKMIQHQAFLLVKSDNPRAIKFYERHGMTFRKRIAFKNFSSDLMVLSWP